VQSVLCIEWPVQAASWPARPRACGWPDAATVRCAVDVGCDLVKAAHRQWKRNDSIRKVRWRFSFARAETVLLNSWTPKQQIVYNILRGFIRITSLNDLKDVNGDVILTTYHVKTLMMWSCEQKPCDWWRNSNIVQLSRDILQSLKDCCVTSNCSGYFVNETNLFENAVPLFVMSRLQSFTDLSFLTSWLINNYILSVGDCPHDVECLFDDVSTNSKLQSSLNALDCWNLKLRLIVSVHQVQSVMQFISTELPKHSRNLDELTLRRWRQELTKVDERLCPAYAVPMFFFSVLLTSNPTSFIMSSRLLGILTSILMEFEEPEASLMPSTSRAAMLHKAVQLLVARQREDKLDSVRSSVLLILTYFYLRLAGKRTTNDNQWLRCLADVYLAVLYYITGQYQKVVKYCKQIMTCNDSHSLNFEQAAVIESRCLPNIDDDVDNVLGLTVLYSCQRFTRTFVRTLSDDSESSLSCKRQRPRAMGDDNTIQIEVLQHFAPFRSRLAANVREL
jgi:Mab-21 protein